MTFTVLALSIRVSAEQSGDGWTFDETTGTLTVTDDRGVSTTSDWNLVVGKESVITANIQEGVTKITNRKFAECTNLTSITLPESLTSIGSSAFDGCSSLTSLLIPTNIDEYGINVTAFNNCPNLKTIFIPDCFDGTMYINVSGQTA